MQSKCPFPAGSRVNGYLRDSGGDEQDLSVPQQESVVREFCTQHQLVLVHLFKDLARPGGTTVGRDDFDHMMAHFLGADCQEAGLILWSLARFARDDMDSQLYKIQLRKAGYLIHSMIDNLPDGIYGRLVEYVIDFNNALFRETLSKEVKRGHRFVVGKYGGMPGTPPVGFKRGDAIQIGTKRNGQPRVIHKWVVDETLADRVKLAWQMRAAGASYKEIHKITRLYGSKGSYATHFRNELYRGVLVFNELRLENYCPPLVDTETWQAVQALQKVMEKQMELAHPRRAVSQFLLTGLVRCAKCGAAMNGEVINTQKTRRAWSYYLCNNRKRYGRCLAERVPQELLEQAILADVVEYVLQPETLKMLQETYEAGREGEDAGLEQRRAFLQGELTTVKRQVTHLVKAIAATGHNEAILGELRALQSSEKELEAAHAELDELVRPARPLAPFDELILAADGLRAALEKEPFAVQRDILRGLIERVEVHREGETVKIGITYYYFFEGMGVSSPKYEPLEFAYARLPREGMSFRWRTWPREITAKTK